MTENHNGKTIPEHLQSISKKSVARGKAAVSATNKRTLVIRDSKNKSLFEINLTAAIVVMALAFMWAWPIVLIAAIASYVTKIRLEILHEVNDGEPIDLVVTDEAQDA